MRPSARVSFLLATAIVAACLSAPAVAKTAKAAHAAPLTDANIAAIVLAANTIDIDNAQVALKTSTDESVKSFAQQMVTDHTSVNDKAKALAGKLKLTPKPNAASLGLTKSMKAKRLEIAKLSGAAFDKAYLDNEISYHQAVIDMLDKQLVPGAKNAELKDLLVSVQPAFQAHLDHAKSTRAALKD